MDAILFEPPPVLLLMAHEVRWKLLRALAWSDYRVNELVERVERPLNLVSYHLKQLRQHQLVVEHRSAADGRDVYYHLDLDRLRTLYQASGDALHPAIASVVSSRKTQQQEWDGPPARILFLCTHNSARSQMAEALARNLGNGRIEAFSAGNEPGSVHPDAVRAMDAIHIDISQQTSKHLEQFRDQQFDYIITVCDRVRETCPVFPNDPEQIHWSLPDPSTIEHPIKRYEQFRAIARELTTRISYLMTFLERKRAEQ